MAVSTGLKGRIHRLATMRPYHPCTLLLLATPALAQWSELPTANAPTPRSEGAMTYDLTNTKTVLFGGSPAGSITLRNDTWLFDGTDWTQATPTTSPTGRFGCSMVHDHVRGVSVLFGGIASAISIAAPSNQTWEWNGTDWTQRTPTTSPSGRAHYGLAYDSVRQRVVLYGGATNPGLLIVSNQTWEFDGITWTQTALTSAANPGPRQYCGMTFHPALNRTVLFGGIDPHTTPNNDTWLYDGTNWTLAPVVSTPPSPRNMTRLVYDNARGVCLLQGGASPTTGTAIVDTWAFDGVAWAQENVPQPSTRTRFMMAYDMAAARAVVFGGVNANQGATGTWLYGAFATDLGAGCAGSNGTPRLTCTARPQFGFNATVEMDQLANGAAIGAIGAGLFTNPAPLDNYGMPGCSLWLFPDVILFLPVVGGVMTSTFGIPNDPGLLGVTIHEQGLSFDPGANAAGMVVSNALTLLLGW